MGFYLAIGFLVWTGIVYFVGYEDGKNKRPPTNPLILPRPFVHGLN
jgi:hypothetical protein